jgi:DNA-binding MarR family transcriptional regulator
MPSSTPPSSKDWQTLDRVKQASVGQLLLKGARLLDERALARINQEQPSPSASRITFRPAHTSLLPHIDPGGTRLTELARRLGVTKQAAGQLVGDLEQLGVLERADDPADGRAKLVRFTDLGVKAIHHGLGVLRGIEAELERRLGRARMRELHQALAEVVDELSKPEADEP